MDEDKNTDINKLEKEKTSSDAKNYKFHTLTPKNDADLKVYESALDFVFSKKDVKNIAISGAYGAGKSSVIESYKEKNKDKDFLHISLTRFRPETENDTSAEKVQVENGDTAKDVDDDSPTISDTVLKGKILNQLIHQIPTEQIPLSNFRVKKAISKDSGIKTSCFAVLGVALAIFVIYFYRWSSFVDSISTSWLNSVLSLTTCPEMRLVALIWLFVLFGILVHSIIKLQEKYKFIRKATVSGVEVELFADNADLYFDKYLNEILYLFEERDGAIVFEDIDRYDTGHIFEWLHEINRLVNHSRKENPLRFFYLLKDDIFVSKDRTKFFDFIMPVVPIMDGSNSFDLFLECLENTGNKVDDKTKGKLNNEFLQGISLYIDDMRLLQNICNEFSIYNGRINITEQDENKMFAIIAYKNIFPRDFADLQLAKGFMYEIIGGEGKERLIEKEKQRIDSRISSKKDELERVRAEYMIEDELAIIYAIKMNMSYSHHYRPTPTNCRSHIEQGRNNRTYSDLIAEYDNRIAHVANDSESKENRIIRLEGEIKGLNSERFLLTEKIMRSLFTRDNIDGFFNDTIFESETGDKEFFKGIKDSPYFAMLKFLVREGYIDETYTDYMTYFREKSVKRTDKIFLRSVTDKAAKEKSYKLENPDLVASRLPLMYFDQEEVLNFSLFEFLLSDYLGSKTHSAKTNRLIKYIRDNKLQDFIMGYASYAPKLDDFVKVIGSEWRGFLEDYFNHYSIKGAPSNEGSIYDDFIRRYAITILMQVGANPAWVSFVDESSRKSLVNYVSNDVVFLRTDTPFVQELSKGIKEFDIKINAINLEFSVDTGEIAGKIITNHYSAIQDKLLELLYNNDSYAISYNNVLIMLETFYDSPDLDSVSTAGYSVVMSDNKSPLAKYINEDPLGENIDKYVDVILEHCGEVISDDEECALLIINNGNIDKIKRTTYISYLTTVITDIQKIENHELWTEMLKNHKAIKYTAENVIAYFEYCSKAFDDTLIDYINAKAVSVILGDVLTDEEENKVFFHALIRSCSLNNAIYEEYLSQFTWEYRNFAIEDLSLEKLAIVDNLNKIGMSLTSLSTMREHYAEYLYDFICNNITKYFKIAHEDGVFVYGEMLKLLDKEIPVENKIELVNHTSESISVKGKQYPDELVAHIISGVNYNSSDFEYLVETYDKFGEKSKEEVSAIAIREITSLQAIIQKATTSVIDVVLSSNEVDTAEKYEILKAVATKAKIYNLQQWLQMVGLNFFMDVYDKNKRPKFENTDINADMLEIFKERKEITDYELDEENNKFKIKRGGLFSTISENLL